jgi:hypothetical protein
VFVGLRHTSTGIKYVSAVLSLIYFGGSLLDSNRSLLPLKMVRWA